MKLRNEITGDVLHWPPPMPGSDGWTTVFLNGKPLLRIQCIDGPNPAKDSLRLEDGTRMTPDEMAQFVAKLLEEPPR